MADEVQADAPVVEEDAPRVELNPLDLDTTSPEAVLATRDNIVSDGPGTAGF
jgi:hypothetical protein